MIESKISDEVPLFELIIDQKVTKSINPVWSYVDIVGDAVDMVTILSLNKYKLV